MNDRPEHVTCVGTGHAGEPHATCCGNIEHGFKFADPTHAFLNARAGGRLLICQECSAAMIKIIEDGTDR